MLLNFAFLILFISPFDKELLDTSDPVIQTLDKSPFQIASLWLIALHQNFLTHIDGPRSHFVPCSSSFMKQALIKHGFFYGSLLGLDRLIRENKDPWIYPRVFLEDNIWIKKDPVP